MPEYTVRVTQPLRGGGRRVFERFATDAAGQFSFTELHAGEYRVEVLDGEEVIGNTSVSLIDGSMRASGVMVSTEINATRGPGWWGRRSTRWARSVRPRRRQLPQGPSVRDKMAPREGAMRDVELDRRVLGLQSTGEQLCSRQHRRPVHAERSIYPGKTGISGTYAIWETRI